MRIAIIGPGAIGTTIAYELQQILPHITLLGRTNKSIHFQTANQHVMVKDIKSMTDPFDVIIVAVKTHQLESLIPDLNRLTHEETTIILAQNGYGLRSTLPFKYVYQAVVYISGQKKDDEVIHFRDYRLHIQHNRRTEQLKHYLEHTKIELILEDHIETTIWYKLLVNLGINSITALGGNTAQILKISEVYQLCTRLLEEGKQVAMAEGITLPDTIVEDIMHIYAGYPDHMGTSMYYDVMNHQPLEVEAIQGFIYRKARTHHLSTPSLDTVYALLRSHHSLSIQY